MGGMSRNLESRIRGEEIWENESGKLNSGLECGFEIGSGFGIWVWIRNLDLDSGCCIFGVYCTGERARCSQPKNYLELNMDDV